MKKYASEICMTIAVVCFILIPIWPWVSCIGFALMIAYVVISDRKHTAMIREMEMLYPRERALWLQEKAKRENRTDAKP